MVNLNPVNRLILNLILLFGLGLPITAVAGDIEDLQSGQAAFNAGNYELSFSLWQTLATEGHADAQLFVGLSYANGWGINKSTKLAEVWYKKAANSGSAAGQFMLGLHYISGSDTDLAKGVWWLEKAAANGDSSAQRFIKKAKQQGWFKGVTPEPGTATNKAKSLAQDEGSTANPSAESGVVLAANNP